MHKYVIKNIIYFQTFYLEKLHLNVISLVSSCVIHTHKISLWLNVKEKNIFSLLSNWVISGNIHYFLFQIDYLKNLFSSVFSSNKSMMYISSVLVHLILNWQWQNFKLQFSHYVLTYVIRIRFECKLSFGCIEFFRMFIKRDKSS